MARASFHALDAGKAIEHIVLALAEARRRGDATTMPRVFTEASLDRVRHMPPWVMRAALLRSRGAWWLWCEPRRRGRTDGGQLVMDVPAGRYMVDVLDTRVHAWVSRESAAAAPLVVGLPVTNAAALVKIRRVPGSGPRPLV